jgi:hypothetical protein
MQITGKGCTASGRGERDDEFWLLYCVSFVVQVVKNVMSISLFGFFNSNREFHEASSTW